MSHDSQNPSDRIPEEPLVATIIPEPGQLPGHGASRLNRTRPRPEPVPPPPSPPFIRATPEPGGEPLPPFLFHNQQVTACTSLAQWQTLLSQASVADVKAEAEQAHLSLNGFLLYLGCWVVCGGIGSRFDGPRELNATMVGIVLGTLLATLIARLITPKAAVPNPKNREIPDIVRDTMTPLVLLLQEELGPDHPLRLKLDLRDLYLPVFQWQKVPSQYYRWYKHSPILGAIRLPRGILLQWRITQQCRVYTKNDRRSRHGRPKPDKVKYKLKCSLDFQILASAQKVQVVEKIPSEVDVLRTGNLIRLRLRMLSEVRTRTTTVTPGDLLDGITCLLALLRPLALPSTGLGSNPSTREISS